MYIRNNAKLIEIHQSICVVLLKFVQRVELRFLVRFVLFAVVYMEARGVGKINKPRENQTKPIGVLKTSLINSFLLFHLFSANGARVGDDDDNDRAYHFIHIQFYNKIYILYYIERERETARCLLLHLLM